MIDILDILDIYGHCRRNRASTQPATPEIETFPRGDYKRAALIFQINYSAAFRRVMAYRHRAGPALSQSRAILARYARTFRLN